MWTNTQNHPRYRVSVNGVQNLCSDERTLGYHVHYKTLDASDFGVPQAKAYFIVGLDSRRFGTEFHFEPTNKDNTVGQYIQTGVKGYSIVSTFKRHTYLKDDGRPQLVTPESDFPVKTLVSELSQDPEIDRHLCKGPQL